jgi:tetratricopeptide (TPR) repeat protein
MRQDKKVGCNILVLGFLLSFTFSTLLGCRSLPQPGVHQEDMGWVCPEFADLPMRQGRLQEAIELHLEVLEGDPNNALARYHLGYSYGQIGAHEDEIAEYLKAVDLGLRRGHLFYNLGMAYTELGRYEEAKQAFSRAVATEPDYGDNHRGLGLAQYKQGHYRKARESCGKATTLAPEDPDGWHCLAMAAARIDEIGEAWTAVKHLKKLDPDYQLDPFLLDLFPAEAE